MNRWGGARRRLVRRREVPNGHGQLVLRPEMSRGMVPGAVGNDAASSAQSKRVGAGVEHGGGLERGGMRGGGRKTVTAGVAAGMGYGRGVSTGVNGVVGDAAGV